MTLDDLGYTIYKEGDDFVWFIKRGNVFLTEITIQKNGGVVIKRFNYILGEVVAFDFFEPKYKAIEHEMKSRGWWK